jgi:hypothetical protein
MIKRGGYILPVVVWFPTSGSAVHQKRRNSRRKKALRRLLRPRRNSHSNALWGSGQKVPACTSTGRTRLHSERISCCKMLCRCRTVGLAPDAKLSSLPVMGSQYFFTYRYIIFKLCYFIIRAQLGVWEICIALRRNDGRTLSAFNVLNHRCNVGCMR